ncbi:MAG: SPOR domain-containing protein [Rhodoferax sp.]
MAFFKFRKGSDEPASAGAVPESVEAMRRRAKHRLLGAALLVLIGVVGFPLLFDRQPRPISVDIPIEIPDRSKVKPLAIPEPVAPPKTGAAPVVPPALPVSEAAGAPEQLEPVVAEKLLAKPAEKPVEKPASAPVKADDGEKARALLEGKDPDKKTDAAEGRFVVQVGAFADATRAREVRLKVEHAGLKTYTQLVETKEGRRIRVRVGPFAGKSEADKAAEKIKTLNLSATVLSL